MPLNVFQLSTRIIRLGPSQVSIWQRFEPSIPCRLFSISKIADFFAREANSSNGVTEFAMFELEMPYSSAWIVGAQVWVNIKAVYVEGVVSQGAKYWSRTPFKSIVDILWPRESIIRDRESASSFRSFDPSPPMFNFRAEFIR